MSATVAPPGHVGGQCLENETLFLWDWTEDKGVCLLNRRRAALLSFEVGVIIDDVVVEDGDGDGGGEGDSDSLVAEVNVTCSPPRVVLDDVAESCTSEVLCKSPPGCSQSGKVASMSAW